MKEQGLEQLPDERLQILAKNNDEDAINILFARYKSTVNAIARTYFLIGGDMEDIVQEGMLGLYKAIQGYSQDKNASFKTFAYVCIKHQIQTAVKKASSEKNKILSSAISILEQADFDDEGSGDVVLMSSLPLPDDQLIAKESAKELNGKINSTLSGLEKKILMLYLRGYNYNEISNLGGVSKKSIDNALTRIKQKLSFLKDDKKDVI